MSVVSSAELTAICADAIADLDIAGAQAAVIVGDELIETAVGVANVDRGVSMTTDTLVQIGSTTKVFTAALMMQIVDRGLVDLDTPVAAYLPDDVAVNSDERWRDITPRHLMSMTSGLDNGPYRDTGRGDDALRKYVDLLGDIPLHFAPGSAYGYSNASTVVSGLVIESVTGRSWDDVLLEELLGPAGLDQSVTLFDRLAYHPVAVGRFPGETRAFPTWTFGRGMGPAGATLATTAADLARFGAMFLGRGVAGNGARVLSEDAVGRMQTPQVAVPSRVFARDWCLGPYRKLWGATEVWGHGGTVQNGSSTLIWIPELGVAVATVVNTPPRGYPFADAVLDAVVRDRLGVAKPDRPSIDGVGPVDPTPYLGHYEAWGRAYEVGALDGDLTITMWSPEGREPSTSASAEPLRTILRPIGPHRFFPDDDALTSHHTWDIAFGLDDAGDVSLLHNGGFTAPRRVSTAATG